MTDITDRNTKPDLQQLLAYANCPLLCELTQYMQDRYQAACTIQYSGDPVLPGWNLRFKKAGRTLTTVYPREGHFPLLLVIGAKEKPRVEEIYPTLSQAFCAVYESTREGMGQRWLLFDFSERTDAFDDVMRIVQIRRESR